jgi:hypothetical protein
MMENFLPSSFAGEAVVGIWAITLNAPNKAGVVNSMAALKHSNNSCGTNLWVISRCMRFQKAVMVPMMPVVSILALTDLSGTIK